MKTEVRAASLAEIPADVLILPIYKGESPRDSHLAALDAATSGAIRSLASGGELSGRRDEVVYLHAPAGLAAGRLAIVGMGTDDGDKIEAQRRAISVGVRFMRGKRHATIAVADRGDIAPARFGEMAAQAVAIAAIDLSAYKTEERNDLAVEGAIVATTAEREGEVRRGVERGALVAECMNFARDLGNEPGDALPPRVLAERTVAMANDEGLEVEVLDEARMKELGMGGMLGVSRGSEEPPRMVVLRYTPESPEGETFGFVGKAITFDSGGISIKPREGMEWMKYDMCGGAAVVGAMRAIARLKPSRPVVGVVCASENLPSGKALKPGDVIRSYNGKTIEVLNTDAEGRLVLSDGLAYAIEKGATKLVDLATLTGACVIALGNTYAGAMTNHEEWGGKVLGAARAAGEKIWELPMDRAYRELIRSDIADVKNIGGRAAGTITAGYFLREFVGSTPWVHLDIAGTAWVEEERPDIARGATGFGVPTLVELAVPFAE